MQNFVVNVHRIIIMYNQFHIKQLLRHFIMLKNVLKLKNKIGIEHLKLCKLI